MTTADEDWVKSAMTDDAMVVELLVRIHHTPPPPPPVKPLEWTVRQRRSKSISANNKAAHRASPTTPLSWSGGATSHSGGSEESTRAPSSVKLENKTRSKVSGDGEKSGSKKSRKKKTLVELKEEENLLVKERRDLKREITALRVNLETQKARNESLKRMKLEMQPQMDTVKTPLQEESISCQLPPNATVGLPTALPISSVNETMQQDGASDSKFVLPDLNIPFEDPSPDVICGVS